MLSVHDPPIDCYYSLALPGLYSGLKVDIERIKEWSFKALRNSQASPALLSLSASCYNDPRLPHLGHQTSIA